MQHGQPRSINNLNTNSKIISPEMKTRLKQRRSINHNRMLIFGQTVFWGSLDIYNKWLWRLVPAPWFLTHTNRQRYTILTNSPVSLPLTTAHKDFDALHLSSVAPVYCLTGLAKLVLSVMSIKLIRGEINLCPPIYLHLHSFI